MNLGISGDTQARFRGALFAVLQTLSELRFRFIVLIHEVPETYCNT